MVIRVYPPLTVLVFGVLVVGWSAWHASLAFLGPNDQY